VSQGLIEEISAEDMAANAMMAPEKLAQDLTIGTAQDVIDRIKRYEDMGYDEFSFWIDSGMSTDRKRASLSRFIDDVMPAFA
jgi:alkanesulfonate monooxygenase SsuD/methylene tetrahydromethanopterin reductase-like flavin-dependent oxidoreductase (luciferase family)